MLPPARTEKEPTYGYDTLMVLLRGLAGALLWIASLLLVLIAAVLCVTILLLPVGLPLLGYARRLFTLSLKLMLPRRKSGSRDGAAQEST